MSKASPIAPSINDYHWYARQLKRLLKAATDLAEMHGADIGDIQAELDKLHGGDHGIECEYPDIEDLLDSPQTDEDCAAIQAEIEREAEERIATWPDDARAYLERMNSAYEHVCNHLKAAWGQRDRLHSALLALLPLLDRIGFATHEEQAAIREARAVVAEGEKR